MHHLQIGSGIYTLKSELEDLGFKYLLPDEYNKIVMDLNKRKEHREEYLNNIKIGDNIYIVAKPKINEFNRKKKYKS